MSKQSVGDGEIFSNICLAKDGSRSSGEVKHFSNNNTQIFSLTISTWLTETGSLIPTAGANFQFSLYLITLILL